jgi:asparagine synthase (glutamine-hydrolysing)
MFAYAVYDRRKRPGEPPYRILLVRDRLGVKPLFYAHQNNTLFFGSEIKALLAHHRVSRTIDRTALFDYLTYLYVPSPRTAYSSIRKLAPGHLAVWEQNTFRTSEYWDLRLHQPCDARSIEEALEGIEVQLRETVQAHLLSDVPVGVFLSGGLDSSAVAAVTASLSTTPIRTFSIGFDIQSHSETSYARLVAEHYKTDHTERIVSFDTLRGQLPQILQTYDEPFADSSAIPTRALSTTASRDVKVALSGDGGDEVFGGYLWYTAWLRRRCIDAIPFELRRTPASLIRRYWPADWRGQRLISDLASSPLGRYARLMELFSPAQKRLMLGREWTRDFDDYDDYWYWRQYWREDADPLTRLQYLDLKTYLPDDILTKVDRASMAESLEVRPPLLDHVLVEQVFSLPTSWRWSQGKPKFLLKTLAQDILPSPILTRRKKGFSAPMTPWIQASRDWVVKELRSGLQIGLWATNLENTPWMFDRGAKVWGSILLQQWLHQRDGGTTVVDGDP